MSTTDTAVAKILILEEGNGRKAIDISSPETHQSVALAIVKYRSEMGYYAKPTEPTAPELTQSQVRKLPEGQFRLFGQRVWQQYREDRAKWVTLQEEWTQIKACIDTEDGEAAIAILESRRQFDGENFTILEVQSSY